MEVEFDSIFGFEGKNGGATQEKHLLLSGDNQAKNGPQKGKEKARFSFR